MRESAASGVAVAGRLGDPALIAAVRQAFTHGMDVSFLVAAAVTLAGAVIGLVLLPGRKQAPASPAGPEGPGAMEREASSLAESGA